MADANPLDLLDAIAARILGPWGAVFALLIVVYFLWRLYREKERDLKASDARVDSLAEAVRDLTTEIRARRR